MKPKKDTECFELPNSPEAERAVIGVLLIESTAINEVDTILNPDVFYNPKLAVIYSAITSLVEKGERPDMITVMQTLIQAGRIEQAGGIAILPELASLVASSVNIVEYSLYLHQLYLARKMVIAGHTIAAKALDQANDIGDTISESLRIIEEISDNTCFSMNTVDLKTSAIESISLYQEREKRVRNGEKVGISTGLETLDKVLGGWKPQQLIVVAARPAMGKTAFMLHFTRVAAQAGIPVLIFSLEMSAQALTDRMIISESNLKSERFKNGYLSENEKNVLCDAANKLSWLTVTIDHTAGISIQQIKAKAKNLHRKGKCGMIMIDYLQLLDVRNNNKSYNREQEVAQATREAKQIAKELDIPVILLSQLSREVEKRANKLPQLSDLRESGAIEQDADIVLFIHRPEYYDISEEKGTGILRIGKQRDGASGDIKFRYNESITRITDYDNNKPF